MAATRQEIQRWFKDGVNRGATHLIVATDTFDYTDYPVYVSATENVRTKESELNGKSMNKVMEVYSLSMDMEAQLDQERAFNYN